MIRFLKALLVWCDTITALVIYSEELSPNDRETIKLQLKDLKEAAAEIGKEDNARSQENSPG